MSGVGPTEKSGWEVSESQFWNKNCTDHFTSWPHLVCNFWAENENPHCKWTWHASSWRNSEAVPRINLTCLAHGAFSLYLEILKPLLSSTKIMKIWPNSTIFYQDGPNRSKLKVRARPKNICRNMRCLQDDLSVAFLIVIHVARKRTLPWGARTIGSRFYITKVRDQQ